MSSPQPTGRSGQDKGTVVVVDDDAGTRDGLVRLLEAASYRAWSFESAEEFLSGERPPGDACLVLDVRMPGMGGLDLQNALETPERSIPIVFVTGFAAVSDSVRAMRAGAVDFLEKPIEESQLLDAIERAFEMDRQHRTCLSREAEVRRLFASLTPRERQVLELVVTGMLNKQIALVLGTSEKTVKVHRGQVMRKMQAASLPHLVRLAQVLGH